MRMLILSYTIQVVVPNFKVLGAVVPEKPLTQTSLCITLEGRMEKRSKEGKINFNIVGFLLHNMLQPSVHCTNIGYNYLYKKCTVL